MTDTKRHPECVLYKLEGAHFLAFLPALQPPSSPILDRLHRVRFWAQSWGERSLSGSVNLALVTMDPGGLDFDQENARPLPGSRPPCQKRVRLADSSTSVGTSLSLRDLSNSPLTLGTWWRRSTNEADSSQVWTEAEGRDGAQPGPSPFDLLSDELILDICQFLPKCSLARLMGVSKRLYRLCQDESLWRRIDLGLKVLPPGTLDILAQRGVWVLRLTKSTLLSPVLQRPLSWPASPELMYLDLSMASVDVSDLEKLLAQCQRLRKVALENLTLSDPALAFLSRNRELRVVHLALTRQISLVGIERLLSECGKLEDVNLAWTGLNVATLDVVARVMPRGVTRLNLSGCRETLNNKHVQSLVRRCSRLVELDLSDALHLTGDVIESIVAHLGQLESLSTSRCYSVFPAAYLELTRMPSLRFFNVFGIFKSTGIEELKEQLSPIEVNKFLFSSIARPTVGIKRTSLWGLRVRD
ncbi:S-phase kinase-associated protein 2-like [Tigriopus californicus]|uniref:S-phase kinase-associated protein 2-like n=1 Tax=Tigriopus californicus TaxID=6832 RepID=UPI0027DA02E0|nr:S-phase kinase-associated protein 2-like [Tigriopus californicus]|eukprot:TCALIF_01695-PA protein Name:"Similar to SKP2 S-phase kinase-associated protein 2 (Homo sapiens)" AED:0.53 eAED:0.53 QI:0/-1/0/1/-1/1/1/0/470